ncbi:hypothetical protein FXF51_08290 [Nonomuraea sp. PA05]|uniref:MauE/DoxX family redox-associated membrane protein n=1 Tax=Nonomuraea sp. PA05 TaxID=2604466 RepID=UPI0011D79366|nr:MauE/DoxX family redox-associated membrane protein [Nonomuraea sp. PA05]TYB69223.1 hypothetical protein FXF51_08290 [Nonomuraea sp. PA05]
MSSDGVAIVCAAASLGLVAVLLAAALTKVRDVRAFARDIAGYRLLPGRLTTAAAPAVIAAEVVAVVLLAVPGTRRWGGVLAALLFTAFLTAIGSALVRRLDVPCGCFGGAADRVSVRTLARTGLLLVLAVMAVLAGDVPFEPVHLLPAPLLVAAALLAPALLPAKSAVAVPPGPRAGDRFVLSGRPAEPGSEPVLYALISPACRLCTSILPALIEAALTVNVVLVTAADAEESRRYLAGHGVRLPLVVAPDVFEANDIPWPPYGVVVGRDGRVLAAGGVPAPADVAALVTRALPERGAVPSS